MVSVKRIKEILEETLREEKHLLRSNAFKIIQNLLVIASKLKATHSATAKNSKEEDQKLTEELIFNQSSFQDGDSSCVEEHNQTKTSTELQNYSWEKLSMLLRDTNIGIRMKAAEIIMNEVDT